MPRCTAGSLEHLSRNLSIATEPYLPEEVGHLQRQFSTDIGIAVQQLRERLDRHLDASALVCRQELEAALSQHVATLCSSPTSPSSRPSSPASSLLSSGPSTPAARSQRLGDGRGRPGPGVRLAVPVQPLVAAGVDKTGASWPPLSPAPVSSPTSLRQDREPSTVALPAVPAQAAHATPAAQATPVLFPPEACEQLLSPARQAETVSKQVAVVVEEVCQGTFPAPCPVSSSDASSSAAAAGAADEAGRTPVKEKRVEFPLEPEENHTESFSGLPADWSDPLSQHVVMSRDAGGRVLRADATVSRGLKSTQTTKRQRRQQLRRSLKQEEKLYLEESRTEAHHRDRTSSRLTVEFTAMTWRERCLRLVLHRTFQAFMDVCIFSNCAIFGAEVQYMAEARTGDTPMAFTILAQIYTSIFLLELLLRVMAHRSRFIFSEEWAWNALDVLVVSTSLVELAMDSINHAVSDDYVSRRSSTLTSIRILRIARSVRLFRVLRIMRSFRSLRILVFSILNTMRSLFWALVLLFINVYLFGSLLTQATTDFLMTTPSSSSSNDLTVSSIERYWGTLPRSMVSLFKAIAGGVTWQDCADPLMEVSVVWFGVFICYISFTTFAVLNVVTGVFCQTAIESAAHDPDVVLHAQLACQDMYEHQLAELFKSMNLNGSGTMSISELETSMADPKVRAFLASMDIAFEEPWTLFRLLDSDGSHIVDLDEFVRGCMRLKGYARSSDVATLMYEVRWLIGRFGDLVCLADDQYEELQTLQAQLRGKSVSFSTAASDFDVPMAQGAASQKGAEMADIREDRRAQLRHACQVLASATKDGSGSESLAAMLRRVAD